jgi:acyl carrier protein
MTVSSEPAAHERITKLVVEFLARRDAPPPADLDLDLRTAGLTSLDLVNLMLAVEGEFDIFIPEEQMTPANFRTVAAIEALVATLS